ncbi:hypothetical protein LPTSP4_07310 [Leptospira ryugenii]|uniref:Uncharacterized protein n=1 Tax=Leptospira ryugenii TaxID=1917863 RepID=A0A2P2DX68_9LEPT|nr:hypothetical protein [Leptospira ryugenii]GBF49221.1 hypothetical protein LPTSP4_07310 [Leptospira ryugenii]
MTTVPDAYVREEVMNEEQKTAVKAIKQRIISLNSEINALKKTIEVNAQSIRISKSKIQKHIASKDLANEKEKLALIKEDPSLAKRYLDESQSAELERGKEESRLQAWNQKQSEDQANLKLKEATLSEAIAELELVRSEIGIKYQEFQGKTTKDPEYIDKTKFDTQYNERKSETRRRTAEWEKIKNSAPKIPKINIEDTYSDEIK